MAKTKKVAARVSIQKAVCEVFSTTAFACPLCHKDIPPNTHHKCSVDGGVRKSINRPVRDLSEWVDEL